MWKVTLLLSFIGWAVSSPLSYSQYTSYTKGDFLHWADRYIDRNRLSWTGSICQEKGFYLLDQNRLCNFGTPVTVEVLNTHRIPCTVGSIHFHNLTKFVACQQLSPTQTVAYEYNYAAPVHHRNRWQKSSEDSSSGWDGSVDDKRDVIPCRNKEGTNLNLIRRSDTVLEICLDGKIVYANATKDFVEEKCPVRDLKQSENTQGVFLFCEMKTDDSTGYRSYVRKEHITIAHNEQVDKRILIPCENKRGTYLNLIQKSDTVLEICLNGQVQYADATRDFRETKCRFKDLKQSRETQDVFLFCEPNEFGITGYRSYKKRMQIMRGAQLTHRPKHDLFQTTKRSTDGVVLGYDGVGCPRDAPYLLERHDTYAKICINRYLIQVAKRRRRKPVSKICEANHVEKLSNTKYCICGLDGQSCSYYYIPDYASYSLYVVFPTESPILSDTSILNDTPFSFQDQCQSDFLGHMVIEHRSSGGITVCSEGEVVVLAKVTDEPSVDECNPTQVDSLRLTQKEGRFLLCENDRKYHAYKRKENLLEDKRDDVVKELEDLVLSF